MFSKRENFSGKLLEQRRRSIRLPKTINSASPSTLGGFKVGTTNTIKLPCDVHEDNNHLKERGSPRLSYWKSLQLPIFKADTIVSAISSAHWFLAWRLKLRLVDERRMKHWLQTNIARIHLCLDALQEKDLRAPPFEVIWNSWNSCPASAVLLYCVEAFLVLTELRKAT